MEPQETVEQPRKKQKQHHPTGHEQSVKRATVEWFFDRLGRPPREQWDGQNGAVVQIRDLMFPELGNREGNKHNKTIKRTLEAMMAPREEGEAPPSPYKATRGSGATGRSAV